MKIPPGTTTYHVGDVEVTITHMKGDSMDSRYHIRTGTTTYRVGDVKVTITHTLCGLNTRQHGSLWTFPTLTPGVTCEECKQAHRHYRRQQRHVNPTS